MSLRKDHELHGRRGNRNKMLGLVLGAFVVLVFSISIVKMMNGDMMEAYDHTPRVSKTAPVE